MRILICLSAWKNGPAKGGVSDLVDDVALKAHEMGHSVSLVSMFGEVPDGNTHFDFIDKIQELEHPEGAHVFKKAIYWSIVLVRAISYFVGFGDRAGKFDIIISAGPLFSFILPWFFKKVVIWENVSFFPNMPRGLFSRLRLAAIPKKRAYIISPTREETQKLNGKWFCPSAINIPNWPSRLVEPCVHSVPQDGKILLMAAGALERRKGFDLAIRAVSILQNDFNMDIQLNIFGVGKELKNLQSLAANCGTREIYFRGHVEDLHSRYKDYHCFLLSSRIEGFPLVLVSALAAGIPAIAFDCPTGPSEIIKEKVNGYLAKNGDIDDLAHQIKRCIDSPTVFSEPKKIRESVKPFGFDFVIRELFEFFETI